jgi:hypothetical protein
MGAGGAYRGGGRGGQGGPGRGGMMPGRGGRGGGPQGRGNMIGRPPPGAPGGGTVPGYPAPQQQQAPYGKPAAPLPPSDGSYDYYGAGSGYDMPPPPHADEYEYGAGAGAAASPGAPSPSGTSPDYYGGAAHSPAVRPSSAPSYSAPAGPGHAGGPPQYPPHASSAPPAPGYATAPPAPPAAPVAAKPTGASIEMVQGLVQKVAALEKRLGELSASLDDDPDAPSRSKLKEMIDDATALTKWRWGLVKTPRLLYFSSIPDAFPRSAVGKVSADTWVRLSGPVREIRGQGADGGEIYTFYRVHHLSPSGQYNLYWVRNKDEWGDDAFAKIVMSKDTSSKPAGESATPPM